MGEEAEYLNETVGVDYEFSKYVHEKDMERTSNYSANDGSRVRSRCDCGGYCANYWKNCSKKRRNRRRQKND